MAFVQNLRSQVEKCRKYGYVQKLRVCVNESRMEEIEMDRYARCMVVYKNIFDNPFEYTFDHMLAAEDVLDSMIMAAVADQRKLRKHAEMALKQMQSA